jgi:glyoxylase-like metal-dependent hydrolase (beta-lactamase superfamily II)
MHVPPAYLHREEGRMGRLRALGVRVPREEWVEFPVAAFLVEHPGAGPILVDTGFHPAVAVDPKQGIGPMGGLLFKDLAMSPDEAIPAQLRHRRLDPGSIRTVVMTHLHADHASGIAEFPRATFLLSKQEWDAAARGKRLEGYIRRQFDHAFDYRTVDFDADVDSFATFGRSVDVFGDGSVRMVYTPGHSHGHCSVVLRLKGREALLTADAAYTMRTIRDSQPPYVMADEHRFMRSLREIRLYLEATPDALVIPGHDTDAWKRLDPVYE